MKNGLNGKPFRANVLISPVVERADTNKCVRPFRVLRGEIMAVVVQNFGIYLEVDASDLIEELKRLEGVLTPQQINRCMYRIFTRVPGHIRQTLPGEVRAKYKVKAGQVRSSIGGAKIGYAGGYGSSCSIPIRGMRLGIGRDGGFSARGGAHGWKSVKRKYRVKANIVQSGISTLPPKMKTGFPPFRNLSAPGDMKKVAFKRLTKARGPIQSIVDIAIPQMPMNRSRKEVEKDIHDYMQQRMEHEIQRMIAGK